MIHSYFSYFLVLQWLMKLLKHTTLTPWHEYCIPPSLQQSNWLGILVQPSTCHHLASNHLTFLACHNCDLWLRKEHIIFSQMAEVVGLLLLDILELARQKAPCKHLYILHRILLKLLAYQSHLGSLGHLVSLGLM